MANESEGVGILDAPLVDTPEKDELEELFFEESSLSCQCSHTRDRRGTFCGLNLHNDADGGMDGEPCRDKAEWLVILGGICHCGREILTKPWYLCDHCRLIWSEFEIHSEKL